LSVALLVLLPILLSGYIFSTVAHLFSYRIMRLDGYHLYFRAATYGSFFVSCSLALFIALHYLFLNTWLGDLVEGIKHEFNASLKISDSQIFELLLISVGSVLLSSIFARLCNAVFPYEFSHWFNIQNDDFELLLYRAITNNDLIQVTMENKKVYVGFVVRGFRPTEERKHLRILPVISGYRGAKGKVHHTTQYEDIYENISENKTQEELIALGADFEIILPVADIKSAHIYIPDVFKQFSRAEKKIKQKIDSAK